MVKTCRTCGSLQAWCHVAGILPPDGGSFGCELWGKRETPLVVDELAAALYWLLNLHHGVSKGGPRYEVVGREWDEALQAGMQAHSRYQEFDKSERIC